MQTFLPYSSYQKSAQTLDNKRLGKQRVENLQIMQVLLSEKLITSDKILNDNGRTIKIPRPKSKWQIIPHNPRGWRNHPAVLMWKNHELELFAYQRAICLEWVNRGFKDTCLEKTEFLLYSNGGKFDENKPNWLGDAKFHKAHRSNLKRKDANFYGKLWPKLTPDLPYVWPS